MQQQKLLTTPAQTSDEIARLAQEQKLGTPQGSYAILKLVSSWQWRYSILLAFLCAEIILLASTAITLFLPNYPIPPADALSPISFWIPLCHCGFLTMAMFTIMGKEYNLYPCEEGFILKESKKKFRTVRWNEIEHVWCTVAHTPKSGFNTHRAYKIQCYNGYTLAFSGSVPALAEFDDVLDKHFTQRRLPAYLADYEAGRILRFGPLTISLEGVGKDDMMLPWPQIADISLHKKRRLIIAEIGNQASPWLNIAAWNILDLPILLVLIERIREAPFTHKEITQPVSLERKVKEEHIQLAPVKLQAKKEPSAAAKKLRIQLTELPEDIATLANEYQLGERRTDGRFGVRNIVIWPTIVAPAIIFLILAAIPIGMFNIINTPIFDWEQTFNNILRYGTLLIFSVMGLLFFIPLFRHLHHYTYTFEQGIILKCDRKAPIICRWDEIEAAWRASLIGQRPVYFSRLFSGYTLQQRDGSRLTLTQLDVDLEAFGKILREQVTPLQMPAILAAYQDGQTLPFGPLRISQQGIALGARLLPWAQVKSVALVANSLVIYDITQRKPWGKLAAARVPNLYVLFALADEVREQAISPDN